MLAGQPLIVQGARKARNVPPQAAGCYMLPLEYSATSEEPVVRAAHLSCSFLCLLTGRPALVSRKFSEVSWHTENH